MTQKELKNILTYDSLTGIFKWREFKSGRNSNLIAGGIHKSSGYHRIHIDGVKYRSHRLAFLYVYGYMPEFIDHKDRVRDNNRISNLIDSTSSENGMNKKMLSNNTSGVTGVKKMKSGKFRAVINVKKKQIHLGYFDELVDAAKARKNAEVKYNFNPNHGL